MLQSPPCANSSSTPIPLQTMPSPWSWRFVSQILMSKLSRWWAWQCAAGASCAKRIVYSRIVRGGCACLCGLRKTAAATAGDRAGGARRRWHGRYRLAAARARADARPCRRYFAQRHPAARRRYHAGHAGSADQCGAGATARTRAGAMRIRLLHHGRHRQWARQCNAAGRVQHLGPIPKLPRSSSNRACPSAWWAGI